LYLFTCWPFFYFFWKSSVMSVAPSLKIVITMYPYVKVNNGWCLLTYLQLLNAVRSHSDLTACGLQEEISFTSRPFNWHALTPLQWPSTLCARKTSHVLDKNQRIIDSRLLVWMGQWLVHGVWWKYYHVSVCVLLLPNVQALFLFSELHFYVSFYVTNYKLKKKAKIPTTDCMFTFAWHAMRTLNRCHLIRPLFLINEIQAFFFPLQASEWHIIQ